MKNMLVVNLLGLSLYQYLWRVWRNKDYKSIWTLISWNNGPKWSTACSQAELALSFWGKWAEFDQQCDTHKEWCAFTCTPTSHWAPPIPRVGTLARTFSFWWIQLAFSCQHSQHLGEIRTLVLKEMSKCHNCAQSYIHLKAASFRKCTGF